MRIVVDGLPIRGDSLAIVVEHMLQGWEQLDADDEIHLVVGPDPRIVIPSSVVVHEVPFGRVPSLSRLYAQSVVVPRLCRELDADVMLGVLPTTTVTPLPCPRAVLVYDLRHRLRPEQFSRKALLLRRVSYAAGFHQADVAICISERTKRDLQRFQRRFRVRSVPVAHLGADHVDTWPVNAAQGACAIAFGHYVNKNVDLVLEAWAALGAFDDAQLPLQLVGIPDRERARVQARVDAMGLRGAVVISPWLADDEYRERFASSSLVVFPSDFEGFGLPAVEAMRLGIPLVVTPEPALLEVTAGHATVTDDAHPECLARAVRLARAATPADLAAARLHAAQFTWSRFAGAVRAALAGATGLAWRPATVAARPAPVSAPAPAPDPAPARQPAPPPVPPGVASLAPARARRRLRWVGAAAVAALGMAALGTTSYALVAGTSPPVAHATVVGAADGHGTARPVAPTGPGAQDAVPAPRPAAIGSGPSVAGAGFVPITTVPESTLPSVALPTRPCTQVTLPTTPGLTAPATPKVTAPCTLSDLVGCLCG
ncbi:MAG TPA: glycosyltransferase [Acidimicrobiales bacterium]|nr:glycosyltransferase [Acidimicrobiales bacterium]